MARTFGAAPLAAAAVLGVLASACGSGGPKVDRSSWTTAGLRDANAVAARLAKAFPGQCGKPGENDFAQFVAVSMKRFRSDVLPLAQTQCDVGGELLEITVFADARQRDRYLDDRAGGLCRVAAELARKSRRPNQFPGTRWVVGAGNVTIQPDSEGLSRRIAAVTGGRYVPRPCRGTVTMDWEPAAVAAVVALGARVARSGQGCRDLEVVGRETLQRTARLTSAELPAALATCTFAGSKVELVAFSGRTRALDGFIARRVASACGADPSAGQVRGDGFVAIAPGTTAEALAAATGGRLSAATCAGASSTG